MRRRGFLAMVAGIVTASFLPRRPRKVTFHGAPIVSDQYVPKLYLHAQNYSMGPNVFWKHYKAKVREGGGGLQAPVARPGGRSEREASFRGVGSKR